MIQPAVFFDTLQAQGIDMYVGVPDSLLKNLCSYITDKLPENKHIIAANEGNALAMAAGYHLGSGKIAAVYLQNSGIGNLVNPATSLTDSEVYQIPALLIIGWRGEPGEKDEPQHVKQGKITPDMLTQLGIPYQIVNAHSNIVSIVNKSIADLQHTNSPVALLIQKDTFADYTQVLQSKNDSNFLREDAIRTLLELSKPQDAIIATTGKTSRELYELRISRNERQQDFLTVGSMGHTSSIAFGVALAQPHRRVLCLDGDGSFLMHMGAAAIIGNSQAHNLVHIILNNQSHESVGGQPTVAGKIDFRTLSQALGYAGYLQANSPVALRESWSQLSTTNGPWLVELRIANGSRSNLGRPASTPVENKCAFMEHCHGQ